jgi:hypothetical protein
MCNLDEETVSDCFSVGSGSILSATTEYFSYKRAIRMRQFFQEHPIVIDGVTSVSAGDIDQEQEHFTALDMFQKPNSDVTIVMGSGD